MTAKIAGALAGDVEVLRAASYDPDSPFWRAADEHHVDLLLLDRGRRTGADRAWPPTARERARAATVDAVAIRELRDYELRRVIDSFAAAGIPSLVFKGAALAYVAYAPPHTRRRIDADLLIRADDAARVAALLEEAGYGRAAEISGEYASSQMHFDRSDCPDHRYALDIHWRALNALAFAGAADYDAFTALRQPVPALGPHAWTLGPAHALALACMHRVAHHRDSGDLAWLWDVHLLASALQEDAIGSFVTYASRSGTRAVCAHTLSLAHGRFKTTGAAALIRRVQPEAGAPEEASARFLRGTLSQTEILRSDLASLGWRRGVTLVREHLFPSTAYMRSAYAAWPAMLLPAAYVHRIVCGAPRWLRRP